MHKNHMPSFLKFGFSTKVTKTKAENIRERDKRGALRKKQKFDNCIINIDDYYIDFGGLGVGGDTVELHDALPISSESGLGPIQLQETQPQYQEFDRDELWPRQLWQHCITINEQEETERHE